MTVCNQLFCVVVAAGHQSRQGVDENNDKDLLGHLMGSCRRETTREHNEHVVICKPFREGFANHGSNTCST